MSRRGRQGAERRGRRAEALAAWWLRLKGYGVLERRAVTGFGEIDLVVRRGGRLAFVEVKARADTVAARSAITATAQRRLTRAAAAWRAGRPELAALAVRFDLVIITPRARPMHIPDAWRPSDGDAALL